MCSERQHLRVCVRIVHGLTRHTCVLSCSITITLSIAIPNRGRYNMFHFKLHAGNIGSNTISIILSPLEDRAHALASLSLSHTPHRLINMHRETHICVDTRLVLSPLANCNGKLQQRLCAKCQCRLSISAPTHTDHLKNSNATKWDVQRLEIKWRWHGAARLSLHKIHAFERKMWTVVRRRWAAFVRCQMPNMQHRNKLSVC